MKNSSSLGCIALLISCAGVYAQTGNATLLDAATRYEAAAPVALIDRHAFIAPAKIKNVLLAPDGTHLAYLANEGHDTALYLYDAATGAKTRLFSSPALASIHWMSDSAHLIVNLGNAIGAVDLDQPDKPSYLATLDEMNEERFLGATKPVLDAIFISGYSDNDYVLREVDIAGVSREVVRQDAMIIAAVTGGDGAVIVESSTTGGTHITLHDDKGRRELFACALLETCHLLAYQAATNSLWLSANAGGNFIGLAEYSLSDRRFTLRHSDTQNIVDLTAAIFAQQQPVVVQYNDGLLQNYSIDDVSERRLRAVQALLPASVFTPQISNDGNRWLVRETSSVLQHPRYHLFDTTTGMLTEILQEEHAGAGPVNAGALSEQLPVEYSAQDGSTLHGYVSLPKGLPLRSTPMITLVHGGPIGRVVANYSAFTQFLVNRGYIVFEPNFRASTGYGRRYLEQAAGEFGDGLVQQDIIDGVNYLTSLGIGDRDKLAIAGHSFGGFAVLAGLAFTPDLFKAGFASAPAADMAPILRFQSTPERKAGQGPAAIALMQMLFGSVDDAAAMQALSARAPQARLSQITAPLLLIAGGDDQQVPISHVKDYALTLLNQQKNLVLFLDEDEGHGIGQAGGRSQLAYLWMAEEFFANYLNGRKQTLDDPALTHYIERKMLLDANPDFTIPAID